MNPLWIPAIASGLGFLGNIFGGKGDPIEYESVDPALQQRYMQLLDFFLSRLNQGATPLPSSMPISAPWHQNITDASNIWRGMAGLGGMPSQQGVGGIPFQYAGFLPKPTTTGFDPYAPGRKDWQPPLPDRLPPPR